MSRISSMFFMASLLVYYIPKLMKKQSKSFIKAHITLGALSFIAMVCEMIMNFGNVEFFKYVGFSIVLGIIVITGALIKKNRKLYGKLHGLATISFFIYLFFIINAAR